MTPHPHFEKFNDWWERARENRERIERDLGGHELPDTTVLIHRMRDERDIEILSAIYGEDQAREMVRGPNAQREQPEWRRCLASYGHRENTAESAR